MLYYVIGYRYRVVKANLMYVGFYHPKLIKDFYWQFSETIIGMLASLVCTDKLILDKVAYDPNDVSMIRASVENGHKVLILGSHFYNWEWIGVVMPKYLGLKCVAVYKPLSNSFVNKVARRVRQRFGMTLAAMGEVISFLKNDSSQKVYLMIADQSPSIHDEANDLVFLDRMTSFFKGSDKIANRFNLKVYFQSVNKVDDRYYVNFFPLDADVKFIEVYAAYLQSDIARSPEGWLWSHKRWKRQKIYS